MVKIAHILFGWTSTIVHALVIPFFLYDFVLIYNPLGIQDLLDLGRDMVVFNATMLFCIYLLVMINLRLLFHSLRNVMQMNYILYALWCMAEIAVFSSFGAMYMTLISHGTYPYFDCLARIFGYGLMILCFPYAIIALSFVINWLQNSKPSEGEDPALIKFKDDRQRLKLAMNVQSLYYIEAAENYVVICYTDRTGVKKFTLRSSMKKMEELVTEFGIVRCHRTYFVNPSHVKMIRKTPEGYVFADLDIDSAPQIPISKMYYSNLSSLL